MTSEVPNKLYNVKIKDIISSYDPLSSRYYDCVEVDITKGEIYNVTGSSFNFLMYGDNYIEKYLGIKLNKSIKNCVGSVDKSVCVALDNKGKIWTWGYNYYGLLGNGTSDNIKSPICISNLADTEIGQLGSEFKAVKAKFVGTYSSNLIVLGNNGKVYTCGCQNDSLGCTTKRLNLVCVNNTMDGITDIECDNKGIIGYSSDGMWIYGYGELRTEPLKCNIDIKEKILASLYIILLYTDGKVWTLGHKSYIGYTVPSDVTYTQTFECLNDRTDSQLYQKEIQKIINGLDGRTYAVSSDGIIYVWENNQNVQECNIYDEAIQKIYGDMSIEHKIDFLENLSSLKNKKVNGTNVYYRTGLLNGNNWEIYYTSDETQVDSIVKVEIAEYEPLTSKLTEISEILDEIHFKTSDEKIFKINDDGTFTCLKEYTPSTEQEEIKTKVIDGVNIVAQTKNKALDDQGKLYVWDDTYNGGYNSYDVICTTDEEYIIKPIYSSGSGWTAIKQSY